MLRPSVPRSTHLAAKPCLGQPVRVRSAAADSDGAAIERRMRRMFRVHVRSATFTRYVSLRIDPASYFLSLLIAWLTCMKALCARQNSMLRAGLVLLETECRTWPPGLPCGLACNESPPLYTEGVVCTVY
jgi:hypothetical protein